MGRYRSGEAADARDADDTVVQLPTRRADDTAPAFDDDQRTRKLDAEIERLVGETGDIADGLRAIADADANFMPRSFLDGAKSAYEMIVTAFATGDRRTLKNLLEKDVYESFEQAVVEREAKGLRSELTFVGIEEAKITAAEIDGGFAKITVNFVSDLISATRDKDGGIVEGDPTDVQTIRDSWTFARETKSRDPNWKLIATEAV
jgi:predicted lipid-binding transport protein (Tim44 family)